MVQPKLRFSEFDDEWKLKKLKDYLVFQNGLNADKEKFGSGTKFISVMDILNNPFITYDIIRGSVEVDSKTLKNYGVKYGDILFQRSSENREDAGKSNVYLDKENTATFGGFVIRGKKNGEYDPAFLNVLLKSDSVRKEITSKAQGAQHINVGQETLENVKIYIPSIPEQEKIGLLFSEIDAKIIQTEKLISELQKRKKGIMQKIFDQEIRFKDDNGNAFPAWKEYNFSYYLSSRNQKQIPTTDAPLMAFTATGGVCEKGERYDRSFLVKDKNKQYKRTEFNDFIYSSNNLDVGSIGLNKYGTAVISDVYEIFAINDNGNPDFISEFIKNPKILNKVLRYRQGALYGQYRIYAEHFIGIKECFPCLEEQKKIARFFLLIDKKIESEKKFLEDWKQLKKALIQQMFV